MVLTHMERVNSVQMTGLMEAVAAASPSSGQVAVFWLGQAGFLFKTHLGATIAIDPCLSDYCERVTGFKRLIPPVCPPELFDCDILLVSHAHEDHFDADLVALMAAKGRPSKLYGPQSVRALAESSGAGAVFNLLMPGTCAELEAGVHLCAVRADHGDGTPDALGFILDFNGLRLYYAGDTAYSPQLIPEVFEAKPQVSVMPINGEYGNLDVREALRLTREIGSQEMIPCHYWMYAQHGAHPLDLLDEAKGDGVPEVLWMTLGEGLILNVAENCQATEKIINWEV